jgi:hypothetical protein
LVSFLSFGLSNRVHLEKNVISPWKRRYGLTIESGLSMKRIRKKVGDRKQTTKNPHFSPEISKIFLSLFK